MDRISKYDSWHNGALAIFLGASVWGLFWLPLRYFDSQGVHGLWAVALIMGGGLVIALPIAIYRGSFIGANLRWALLLGLVIGLSSVFYFIALLLSDVVRVVFLFYLLPIWTTIAAKIFHKESFGKYRICAIGIALFGLWLLLGGGGSFPRPHNFGDVAALLAGVLWGAGLVLLRSMNIKKGAGDSDDVKVDSCLHVLSTLFLGCILAVIGGLFFQSFSSDFQFRAPDFEVFVSLLPAAILFGSGILWLSMIGQIWGAGLVASPLAALLTMSEIFVATFSAYIFIGTSLSVSAFIGGGLIVCGVLLDIYASTLKRDVGVV